jgi:hypothetical protein
LLEFNVRIYNKDGGIIAGIKAYVEDAENELTFEFRAVLNTASKQ